MIQKNKNVVFVYITDPSSSKNLWEKKKKEIGGEHYYLTDNEMKYIKARFGISGIPTCLRMVAKYYGHNYLLQAESNNPINYCKMQQKKCSVCIF